VADGLIGLLLEGAAYSGNRLALNNGQSVRLGPSQLRWVQVEPSSNPSNTTVNLPVYLNNDRNDVLFTVDLPFEGAGSNLVAMRAVCLTAGG
jgi:dynein heavy chain 1